MRKKEKAINFYKGKICIRNEDCSLSFQDDSCISEIRERIDKYIVDNAEMFSVKSIIFSVIKDYFKVYKTFIPPTEKSYVPTNDSLYRELSHYIISNPIYSARLEERNMIQMNEKKILDNYKSKYFDHNNYLKSKKTYFIRQKRNRKK